jgi:hypothetical protein
MPETEESVLGFNFNYTRRSCGILVFRAFAPVFLSLRMAICGGLTGKGLYK